MKVLNWQPVMKSAISEVLETMFFVLIGFVTQASTTSACRFGSKIELYNDHHKMEISFRVTESFARMITANFLSKDEDEVVSEEMEDVIKELANMVGGNYMSRIESEGWQLGIPWSFDKLEDVREGEYPGMDLAYLGERVGMVDFQTIPSGGM